MAAGGSDHESQAKEMRDEEKSRFRFKHKSQWHEEDSSQPRSQRRSHRHHDSHRRSKRRRVSKPPPDQFDGLPPDAAFRESLFDALGDDEGAAFWENVYGQPIHTYPDTYKNDETGELERMSEEEYAQFVRRKMWEKSYEGIETAREERKRQKRQEQQQARERHSTRSQTSQAPSSEPLFENEIEESLRRGDDRKRRRLWKTLWDEYLQRWQDLQDLVKARQKCGAATEKVYLRNKIPWPVESGRRKDTGAIEIKRFIKNGVSSYTEPDNVDSEILKVLKTERVRWHPDKIQHRYGFMEMDENTLKGVTEVFQVIDEMWNDARAHG